jgi:hypothetical protein
MNVRYLEGLMAGFALRRGIEGFALRRGIQGFALRRGVELMCDDGVCKEQMHTVSILGF